jgi:hypothetical protein
MNTNCNTIPTIEGLTTLEKDKSVVGDKVINNINDFNEKYKSYLECTKVNGNSHICMNNYNFIKSYNDALTNTNLKGNIVYDNSNNYISKSYDTLLNERNDLKTKIKELHKTNDSLYNSDFREKYDSSMLSGVIWSVLAGSILYYTFTKL